MISEISENVLKEVAENAEEIWSEQDTDVDMVRLDLYQSCCPYHQYHRDIGTDKFKCKAYSVDVSDILPSVEKVDIVGLQKPPKSDPVKNAIVLILKITREITRDAIRDATLVTGVKFVDPDFNITYEKDSWTVSKWLLKSLSQILTSNFNDGPIYVAPRKHKEIDKNVCSLMAVTRKKSFSEPIQATKHRTMFYLPLYVVLMHYLRSSSTISLLTIEIKKYGKENVSETLRILQDLILKAQMNHYISRMANPQYAKIPTDLKFYAAMDYNVESDLFLKYK